MLTSSRRPPTANIKQQRQVRVRRRRRCPYYADVAGAPQNTIIGGAIAVGDGRQEPKDEYKGVAEVLHVPVATRACRRSGTRRPATCRSRWRRTSSRRSPASTRRTPAPTCSVEQMIVKTTEQLARRAHRQLRADPRRRSRRSSRPCWRGKKTREGGGSTTPCQARQRTSIASSTRRNKG